MRIKWTGHGAGLARSQRQCIDACGIAGWGKTDAYAVNNSHLNHDRTRLSRYGPRQRRVGRLSPSSRALNKPSLQRSPRSGHFATTALLPSTSCSNLQPLRLRPPFLHPGHAPPSQSSIRISNPCLRLPIPPQPSLRWYFDPPNLPRVPPLPPSRTLELRSPPSQHVQLSSTSTARHSLRRSDYSREM